MPGIGEVVVANSGNGGSNYTGFRLLGGHLFRSPGSTVTLAANAAPGDILFNGTGTKLVGTGAGTGTISAFTDSRTGTLSPVAGSPFPDQQTAPCWVEISHDGRFLFTVNTGSGTISRYQIAGNGTLTLLGSTSVAATGGVGAVDPRLSPDGRYLYINESKIGAVGAFAVTGGALAELPASPVKLPAGATPAGIVVS